MIVLLYYLRWRFRAAAAVLIDGVSAVDVGAHAAVGRAGGDGRRRCWCRSRWRTSSASCLLRRPRRGSGSPIQPRFEQTLPLVHVRPRMPLPATRAKAFSSISSFGLDGISLTLIVLTTVLTVSCVLISWESIAEREAEFYTALLALEAGLIGVFCAFDLMLFYVAFEFTLIPLFFMIGIWGGPRRRYAAVKFFLYTLAGSLITLLGAWRWCCSWPARGCTTPCSLPDLAAWLAANPLSRETQIALFLALSAGFLIKVPVIPFHTWLPLAHVEAPTAGSVLLAGVLLKLGTYGFLRFCLPLLPDACLAVGLPLLGVLAVGGIIYGSLCALAQRDIKKLVAYSSIAHLGFCMLGLFALNAAGITGGVLQMINHGLSTGGLFLIVGMIYERYHTRELDDLGGLASRLPLLRDGAGVHLAFEHRPAGAQRVRRRNPVAGRDVRAAPAVLGDGSDRAGARRVVSADDAADAALRAARGAASRLAPRCTT